MPPVAADDVVIIASSSSSEEGGEGGGKNTSSVRPGRQAAAADAEADSVRDKNMDGVRKQKKKKKRKEREEETSAAPSGKVRRGGEGVVEERKTKAKKKNKEKKKKKNEEGKEEEENNAMSLASHVEDVVATSDEVGCLSPTCSFPTRRVKRIIASSENGGGNSSSGKLRTTLDSVFLINKATQLFLELFSQDAYAQATREHKKAVFYKHLSSTVCGGKRYEFLSDFVPEKVRAEDALKALAEQP